MKITILPVENRSDRGIATEPRWTWEIELKGKTHRNRSVDFAAPDVAASEAVKRFQELRNKARQHLKLLNARASA